MREYFGKVSEHFDREYRAFGMQHEMDHFPKQVFVIVSRLIEAEAHGEFFINVNASELGEDLDLNYANFIAAIAMASARRRFLLNRDNDVPALQDGDLTYRRYRRGQNIFMNRGGVSVLLSEHLANNVVAIFDYVNMGPRLLPMGRYTYNAQNAETSISRYWDWLLRAGLIGDIREMKILNGVKRADLIISHKVGDLPRLLHGIPYATIGESVEFSSPCEPLVYFSRDGNENVIQYLRNESFENVFFVGDSKYENGGPWPIHNQYAARNIYIGSSPPNNHAVAFYRFPNSELQMLFDVPERRIDISIAPDMGHGLADRYYSVHHEAGLNLQPFRAIHRALRLRTFPMDEDAVDRYLLWHRRILNENLPVIDVGVGTYRNAIEGFEALLGAYREGNPAKIEIFRESIGAPRTSSIVFVRDDDEVRHACENYRIQRGSHVTKYSTVRSTISSFARDPDRQRHSLFLFLSYGSGYDDILSSLDDHMLPGKLVFVSDGPKDARVPEILRQRTANDAEIASDICRMNLTHIEFVAPAQGPGDVALEDFHGGYPAELPSRAGQAARYQVAIQEQGDRREYRTGSTCIMGGLLIPLEQVGPGDNITLYSSDSDSFEAAWRALHNQLAVQIDGFSMEWRGCLDRLLVHFENDPDTLFRHLRNSGMRVAYNTFLRYLGADNIVKFPNSISLRAIENLCVEVFPDDAADITLLFTSIRQADRAYDQTRQELGADLSGGILCEELNQQGHPYEMTIGLRDQHPGIYNQIRGTCLHSGIVIEKRIN